MPLQLDSTVNYALGTSDLQLSGRAAGDGLAVQHLQEQGAAARPDQLARARPRSRRRSTRRRALAVLRHHGPEDADHRVRRRRTTSSSRSSASSRRMSAERPVRPCAARPSSATRSRTRCHRCCTGRPTASSGCDWEYDRVDVTPEDCLARSSRASTPVVGRAVADHAAQDGRAPAARRASTRWRWRRAPPTPSCSARTARARLEHRRRRHRRRPRPSAGRAAGAPDRRGRSAAGATARSAVAALARLRRHEVVLVHARRPEAAADLRATAAAVGRARSRSAAGTLAPGDARRRRGREHRARGGRPTRSGGPACPSGPACLLDVVYDPWPTPLAAAWSTAGGTVASGLDLLLHQAVRQVELMTGRTPAGRPMRRALEAAAAAR